MSPSPDSNDFADGLFVRAASLVSLLPSGTYFAFAFLAPIVTNNGKCDEPLARQWTLGLLATFALFCFSSCFTDTVKGADGHVYLGIATLSEPGLCVPCAYGETLLPTTFGRGRRHLRRYGLKLQDFVHAVLSVAIFGVCAITRTDIRTCLIHDVTDLELQYLVRNIPSIVVIVASVIGVTFPTRRRGIGFQSLPTS